LEAASLTLTLAFLGYASWRDWKVREVSDRVWLAYGPLGGLLTALRILLYGRPEPFFWLSGLALSAAVGLALYYAGFWGGADSKALICLALSLPDMPSFCHPLLGLYILFIPFTVLFNGLLLSLTVVAYSALRNLWYRVRVGSLFQGFEGETLGRKILAFLLAFKVGRERLAGNPSLTPAESFKPNGGRRFNFRLRVGEDSFSLEGLPEEVWVTFQLPILLFITAGLLAALLVGDLVLALIAWLLGLLA